METCRRIVTGSRADGRSVVVSDERLGFDVPGDIHLWLSGREVASPVDVPFFPRAGQTIFRVVRLPPADLGSPPVMVADLADRFFAMLGDPACRVDTRRHPLMHATPTLDYLMLLSGEVSLIVDDGPEVPLQPFDCVVQQGVNHAWKVTGSEPAAMLAVMIGG